MPETGETNINICKIFHMQALMTVSISHIEIPLKEKIASHESEKKKYVLLKSQILPG